MHRPTSPEPVGGGGRSFTALLGLPTTQAMELLLPVAPTFPSGPSLVDRTARLSASSSPPAAKRKDPGDRNTDKVKAAKKGRVEAAAGGAEDAEEEEKPVYVHVRARRGRATDIHSLAERARREKINARMELVPGCSKVSGTALVLDEIINHVQSLQRQVEYLSMRLATVNPGVDFGGLDSLLTTECGRVTGLTCKNAMDLEQATWPELGIYGARQLAQLHQQFWHCDVTHPHQLTLMSDKRDDDHPPVLASSGASLLGYDLATQ